MIFLRTHARVFDTIAGVNLHEKDNDRFTALHLAAQEGCYDCIGLLLAAGSDVIAETRLGDNPLSLAAKNGW